MAESTVIETEAFTLSSLSRGDQTARMVYFPLYLYMVRPQGHNVPNVACYHYTIVCILIWWDQAGVEPTSFWPHLYFIKTFRAFNP